MRSPPPTISGRRLAASPGSSRCHGCSTPGPTPAWTTRSTACSASARICRSTVRALRRGLVVGRSSARPVPRDVLRRHDKLVDAAMQSDVAVDVHALKSEAYNVDGPPILTRHGTIELGCRCESGEGGFWFLCDAGRDLELRFLRRRRRGSHAAQLLGALPCSCRRSHHHGPEVR